MEEQEKNTPKTPTTNPSPNQTQTQPYAPITFTKIRKVSAQIGRKKKYFAIQQIWFLLSLLPNDLKFICNLWS